MATLRSDIIIPEVRFNNLTIEAAIRYLDKISAENDFLEADPTRKGVKFVTTQTDLRFLQLAATNHTAALREALG